MLKFHARFQVFESDVLLWTSEWIPNALMNEGERNVLNTYLQSSSQPTNFFVRLFNKVAALTDSLASLTGEPGGLLGYAPQQVTRSAMATGWPIVQNDGVNIAAFSTVVTFGPAIGTWPLIQNAVLATTSDNTGLLIDATILSQSRQLISSQSLQVQYKVTMV